MIGTRQFEKQKERIEYNDIIYLINPDENTASVIGIKENCHKFLIPRSINHESKEYYVISILENAFENHEIKNFQFSSNSKLQTIYKNAFSFSIIKSIQISSSVTSIGESAFYLCQQLKVIEIPDDSKLQTIGKDALVKTAIKSIRITSELIDLKEGWCNETENLTKISVSSKNPRYLNYEDKMIIGKSRIEQNNYDCLVFSVRGIRQIKIPNFIEHICSYSFNQCNHLESIEIPKDSKFQTIDKNAFSFSTIKSIRIPSSVTSIGENAFYFCQRLKMIEFLNDSKLQMIDKNAFSFSTIKSIQIPSSVTSIEKDAFYFCSHLCIIEIGNTEMMNQINFVICPNALLMIPVHS